MKWILACLMAVSVSVSAQTFFEGPSCAAWLDAINHHDEANGAAGTAFIIGFFDGMNAASMPDGDYLKGNDPREMIRRVKKSCLGQLTNDVSTAAQLVFTDVE